MRQSYKITKLAIQHQNTHTASWKGFGRRAIKGTEHIYAVKDANYPILAPPWIAPDLPRTVPDRSVTWPGPAFLQAPRGNPSEPLRQRLRGAGALPQPRSPLSVSVAVKRRASWPQGFLDRSFDSGQLETRLRGAKEVPAQQTAQVQSNLAARAQSSVSDHFHAFILTGGRGVWLWFRQNLCYQFLDRGVARFAEAALLVSETQIDRMPLFIVSPRLSTGENSSPHERRRDDLEEIHKVLLGSWRPRPIAISVFLLRDLQEFAEVSDRFHTGSSRDWRRPGFPGGLF